MDSGNGSKLSWSVRGEECVGRHGLYLNEAENRVEGVALLRKMMS